LNDTHLRFHENCARYRTHKPTALSKEVNSKLLYILASVAQAVQERSAQALTPKTVLSLWNACKFESTALHLYNGACLLFDETDAVKLEYVEDVKDFWTKGFGHALNYDMTCDLIKDVVRFLKDRQVTGRFLFGHAETILPLVARLGLYRDAEGLFGGGKRGGAEAVEDGNGVPLRRQHRRGVLRLRGRRGAGGLEAQ